MYNVMGKCLSEENYSIEHTHIHNSTYIDIIEVPLPTISLHTSFFHQIPHTCSPVSSTVNLALDPMNIESTLNQLSSSNTHSEHSVL
jgi:hypothetical protein